VALALRQIADGLLSAATLYGAGSAFAFVGESSTWMVMATLACGFIMVGIGGGLWIILSGRAAALAPARTGCARQ